MQYFLKFILKLFVFLLKLPEVYFEGISFPIAQLDSVLLCNSPISSTYRLHFFEEVHSRKIPWTKQCILTLKWILKHIEHDCTTLKKNASKQCRIWWKSNSGRGELTTYHNGRWMTNHCWAVLGLRQAQEPVGRAERELGTRLLWIWENPALSLEICHFKRISHFQIITDAT